MSFFFFNFILFYFLTLQYCIGFAIYQHESATGIHVFPILNPPPSLPVSSLWVVSVHQTQASSIVHRTWTGDSFHIWYYKCFNAILPNHPTLSLSHRVQKNLYFWIVVLERTLESPLDCKEIKLINPKGNQSWIFIGRTDAEALILCPPDVKNWLIWKDPDAGDDWRREEKGMTEDEMVGWHHRLNGHEFE